MDVCFHLEFGDLSATGMTWYRERNCAADVNEKGDGSENKQDISSSNLKNSLSSLLHYIKGKRDWISRLNPIYNEWFLFFEWFLESFLSETAKLWFDWSFPSFHSNCFICDVYRYFSSSYLGKQTPHSSLNYKGIFSLMGISRTTTTVSNLLQRGFIGYFWSFFVILWIMLSASFDLFFIHLLETNFFEIVSIFYRYRSGVLFNSLVRVF